MGWSGQRGSAGQWGRSCWSLSSPAPGLWDCTRGRAMSPILQTQAVPKLPVCKRAQMVGMVETIAVLQQNFWIWPCTELGTCLCLCHLNYQPRAPLSSPFRRTLRVLLETICFCSRGWGRPASASGWDLPVVCLVHVSSLEVPGGCFSSERDSEPLCSYLWPICLVFHPAGSWIVCKVLIALHSQILSWQTACSPKY